MLETLGLKPAARHRSREVLLYRQGGRRPNFEERMTTARHFRVLPGDYSFEVFNDDYQQLPLPVVAERARKSALWLAEDVLRRSTPLPDRMTLRRPVLRG